MQTLEEEEELHIPYDDATLRMIDSQPSREDLLSYSPPNAENAKAIAVYKKGKSVPDYDANTGKEWIGVPRMYYTFVKTIPTTEFPPHPPLNGT
jgi:hypothetical protein